MKMFFIKLPVNFYKLSWEIFLEKEEVKNGVYVTLFRLLVVQIFQYYSEEA